MQPTIALIGSLVNEVKITTNQPGAGARGRHVTQFLKECGFVSSDGRPIDVGQEPRFARRARRGQLNRDGETSNVGGVDVPQVATPGRDRPKLRLVCSSSYRSILQLYRPTRSLSLCLGKAFFTPLLFPRPRPKRTTEHTRNNTKHHTGRAHDRVRRCRLGPWRGGHARMARALFSGALLSPTHTHKHRHPIPSHRTRRLLSVEQRSDRSLGSERLGDSARFRRRLLTRAGRPSRFATVPTPRRPSLPPRRVRLRPRHPARARLWFRAFLTQDHDRRPGTPYSQLLLELDPAVYTALHSDQIAKLARHLPLQPLEPHHRWLTCSLLLLYKIRCLASSRMASRLHQSSGWGLQAWLKRCKLCCC